MLLILCSFSNTDADDDAGPGSPGGSDVLMLAVPDFTYRDKNRHGVSEMQDAALLLSKFMTPLRQSNITPLSFVSIQLEKVGCPFNFNVFFSLQHFVITRCGQRKRKCRDFTCNPKADKISLVIHTNQTKKDEKSKLMINRAINCLRSFRIKK